MQCPLFTRANRTLVVHQRPRGHPSRPVSHHPHHHNNVDRPAQYAASCESDASHCRVAAAHASSGTAPGATTTLLRRGWGPVAEVVVVPVTATSSSSKDVCSLLIVALRRHPDVARLDAPASATRGWPDLLWERCVVQEERPLGEVVG